MKTTIKMLSAVALALGVVLGTGHLATADDNFVTCYDAGQPGTCIQLVNCGSDNFCADNLAIPSTGSDARDEVEKGLAVYGADFRGIRPK